MGIGKFFKNIGNSIKNVVEEVGEGIKDVGGEIINTVGNAGEALIKGDMKGVVEAIGEGVVDVAKSVGNNVVDVGKAVGENALEISKSVVNMSPASLVMDAVSNVTGIDIKEKVLDITANTLGSAVPLLGPALKAGVYTVAGEDEKAKEAIDSYKDGTFLNDMPLVGTIKAGVEGRWTDFAIGLASDATFLIPGAGAAAGMAMKTVAKTVVKEGVEETAKAGVKTAVKEGVEETAEAGVKTAVKEGVEETAEAGVKTAVKEGVEETAEAGTKTLTQQAKETATNKLDNIITTAKETATEEAKATVTSEVTNKLNEHGLLPTLPELPAVPPQIQTGLSVTQSMNDLRREYGG